MRISPLLLLLLTLIGCNDNSSDPVEVLPPATQDGKNTFGFMLNGKVWVPKGNHGTSNLYINYDPTFNDGTFDLRAYRYPDESDYLQNIMLFSDSLSTTGIYTLEDGSHQVPILLITQTVSMSEATLM